MRNHTEGTACLFVIGSPRSGTSALAWALAQHPDFETGPEATFPFYLCEPGCLERTWRLSHEREDGWLRHHGVDLAEYLGWIGLGIDRMMLSRSGGKRWIDSTPSTTLVVARVAAMFPRARFVHVVRDGRAVVSSLVRSGFDYPAARSFRLACKAWVQHVEAGQRASETMPDRVLEIRHERVVSEPEDVVRRILDFADAGASSAPAEFLRSKRINSSYGSSPPAGASREEPWRTWTFVQRRMFDYYAGALMRQLGYAEP